MEIKAECKLNYKSVKALTHLAMYKKSNPKKCFVLFLLLYTVLLAFIIFDVIARDGDNFPIVKLCTVTCCCFIWLFLYFIMPKLRFRAMGKMKNAENDYLFSDDTVKASTKSAEYNGEAVIEYTLFVKAYETTEYFFLFQTHNQVFIVDKSTMDNGSVEKVREKFISYLGSKYIICKY